MGLGNPEYDGSIHRSKRREEELYPDATMMTSQALMSKSNFFTSLSPDSLMLSNHCNVNTLPFTFLGDESCSEVSSSSPLTTCGGPSPPPLVNMVPHFNNTEMTEIHQVPDHSDVTGMHEAIGDTPETNIDLNFWELAINASSPSQMFGGGGVPVSSTTAGMNARSFSFFTDEGTSPIGREDLSPASSINSTSLISESGDKKKKGSGGARQTEELCLVCGDRASGYHYNALTCEGCKGFFRRSITKKAVYSCKYGQHCEMDMYMRRKCQECRFKKCISVGMRPECVVPEHTCQVKREQKKAREKDKVIKVEYSAIPEIPAPQQFVPGLPPGLNNLPSSLKSGCRIELTKEHQELINRLINNQDEYETPPEESMTAVPNGSDDEARFQQITEMTKLTVELIVKFALSLPGFMTVPVEDQVTLLKACTSELITLRASRRYHADSDSIVFANNSPCTRDFYKSAGMDAAITDSLFAFCKRMAAMKVDNAEYALLAGIALFSERPSLVDPKRVETIQFLYVETLYAYVTNKWAPKSGTMIAKLLDVLTQLRSLGIMNNAQCETFVSKDKQLPDLLIELWDVNRR